MLTYSCARCGYVTTIPGEVRRIGSSLFNECVDREKCDERRAK